MVGLSGIYRTFSSHSFSYSTARCQRLYLTTTRRSFHRCGTLWQDRGGDGSNEEHEKPTKLADVLRTLIKEESGDRPPRRRLDIAIVGLPNAGKSQLLNCLTNAPVSAVSQKRHTTREGILGARTVKDENQVDTQLLFVDTPGFMRQEYFKKEKLDREILVSAKQEMQSVDFTLIVVDAAKRLRDDVKASLIDLMLQAMLAEGREEVAMLTDDENIEADSPSAASANREPKEGEFFPFQKFAVVLNKVDLVDPKSKLLDVATEIYVMAQKVITYQGQPGGESESGEKPAEIPDEVLAEIMPTFFYTDAKRNDGVEDLFKFLVKKATPATFFEIEPGMATSLEPEDHAEEIIREKLYRCLHQEVPYSIRQENKLFKVIQGKDGTHCVAIHQDLLVRTKSHRDLVKGNKDTTLKRIQESAERTLMKLWGCRVILHLHVKLVESKTRDWSI